MSRRPHADPSLRADDGFSLTELLVAMIVGMVVIFGILNVLDTSIGISARTQQRIDSAQRGRLGLDLVARELRAQTCLSATEPALAAAADSDVTYFVNLGGPSDVPEKHQLVLTSGDLWLNRWVGTRAAAGVIPSVTYPVTATTSKKLLENVQPATGVPIFRYYAWSGGANPTPTTLLAAPLSAANLPLAVKIAISFNVLPDRAFNTTKPTAAFEDSVYTRLADPNDPTHGQACN